MKRRKFLQLSALAGLAGLAGLAPVHAVEPAASPASPAGSAKKGFGIGTKSDNYRDVIQELRAKWSYTWNHRVAGNKPGGVEFVPIQGQKPKT